MTFKEQVIEIINKHIIAYGCTKYDMDWKRDGSIIVDYNAIIKEIEQLDEQQFKINEAFKKLASEQVDITQEQSDACDEAMLSEYDK